MRVIYTDEALRDLDGILSFIRAKYPAVFGAFEIRLRHAANRIGAWPESAPRVAERPALRVVTLTPYPYKLFYQVTANGIEILHLHHAARREPWEEQR